MKKYEFLNRLSKALEVLPYDERIRTLAFYEEMLNDRIEDGMDEEAAVAAIGTVEDITQRILEEVPGTLSIPRKSSERYEKKQYDGDINKIRGVRMFTRNCPVNITTSADGEIHLNYTDTEWEYYDVKCTDGLLEIRLIQTGDFFSRVWSVFHWKERTLTLELPKNFIGGVYAETTNGAFSGRDVAFGGRVELYTTNGAVKLDTLESPGIYVRTTNGLVQMYNVTAGSIKAHTSNGAMMFERMTSPDIQVETSNGVVNGSIFGSISDYRIESRTSNGKSNLPFNKSDGMKSLRAITSNGTIKVDFI